MFYVLTETYLNPTTFNKAYGEETYSIEEHEEFVLCSGPAHGDARYLNLVGITGQGWAQCLKKHLFGERIGTGMSLLAAASHVQADGSNLV